MAASNALHTLMPMLELVFGHAFAPCNQKMPRSLPQTAKDSIVSSLHALLPMPKTCVQTPCCQKTPSLQK